MDKITKLSDAIRLGATFRPQCKVMLFNRGKSCALGAAAEALGYTWAEELKARFPDLGRPMKHPMGERARNLWDIISDLNDNHDWTREQISSWLAAQGL